MSVIALASVKGAPGVTTAALALTSSWPHGPRVVVAELDAGGGDVRSFFQLQPNPGVVSLAAAIRRDADPQLLWRHTQRLPGGLEVVAAPPAPDQARAAVSVLTAALPEVFARLADDRHSLVLADLGRLQLGTPAAALARAANRTLLVVRPVLWELAHLHAYAHQLGDALPGLQVVLVGSGPFTAAEISQTLGLPVAGHLPHDPHTAALLSGQPHRVARRQPLLRAAAALAERLRGDGGPAAAAVRPVTHARSPQVEVAAS